MNSWTVDLRPRDEPPSRAHTFGVSVLSFFACLGFTLGILAPLVR